MLKGHGGNSLELARRLGCPPHEIIDMSSNINPLGPPPGLIDYLKGHVDAIGKFPEVDSREITTHFGDQCGIGSDRVLAGNGTTQFIYALPQAMRIKKALILGPTYSDYADACQLHHVETTFAIAEESQNFQPDLNQIKTYLDAVDSVFICNPNNPTGALISIDDLKALCQSHPNTLFVVDESYLSFLPGADEKSIRRQDMDNLIILVSISKIFAIPGLRIGFVVSSIERTKQLRKFLQPWSVNILAQKACAYLMVQKDEIDTFIEKSSQMIAVERERFLAAFENIPGITLYPSTTNYFIARLHRNLNAGEVCRRLAEDKILVRNCSNFEGLTDRHIRISLKQPEHNHRLAQKLIEMVQTEANQSQDIEKRVGIGG